MQLTANFSLAELVASAKAASLGIANDPPPELMPRLILTAEMLERIRSVLGAPVIVTSGYRCHQLNRAVGGVSSSDHTTGRAADFVAPRFGSATDVAKLLAPRLAELGIGQLILEGLKGKQWVHASTAAPEQPGNRVLTVTDAGLHLGIVDLA
jgi:zinc D-Ala-D-Ala carboxypeptidase